MATAAKSESKPDKPDKIDKRLWAATGGRDFWPLGRIIPYANNPRTHPPAQVTLLAQLLRKYGPDQSIVVDEKGIILKGHGRLQAAREAGLDSFPVTQRKNLSEADKVAMRIADNQVALLSGWDNELVRLEMHVLKNFDYPVDLLGFGEAQLVAFTTTPGPPGAFGTFDESIPTEHQCPRCSYRWSGNTAPPKEEERPKARAKKKAAKKGK